MEEIYEALGLDSDAPDAKALDEIEKLIQQKSDKQSIIEGLQQKIENLEDKFDSIADGVAEARVKDLVQKVQNETGRHVGKDHLETLQNKAARYIYASEEEKDGIYEDMKAHTIAYGTKVGMEEKIKALQSDRSEGEGTQSPEFVAAEKLVESGKAEDWDEAYQMVQEDLSKEEIEQYNEE